MTDAANLYPYVLAPKLTQQIWGGDALVKVYGQPGDPGATLGESWQCWDANAVTNGPLAGRSVADLRGQLGADLLGDIDASRIFPILTKIIDARDRLSVQVHPDDAYAQRVEGEPFGKTECWYVLHADEGAELVLGWMRDTSREEYLKRVADGSLGDILRRVPVRAGDAYYLPSGTLHAIGKGIVVFETQQASDLTYRIFDWNRIGADGKPRELHVDKAADVLNYHRGERAAIGSIDYTFENLRRTLLIADPRFTVERIVASADPASIATQNRPLIAMALDRRLAISCDGGSATLEPYRTALIPAAAGWATFASADDAPAPFMFVTPPPTPETVPVRLLAAGIDQARVDAFMEQFR
jgi:mannose-6-phosphate isomerase